MDFRGADMQAAETKDRLAAKDKEIAKLRQELTEARRHVKATASYLDHLDANIRSNDADMLLDACTAPEIIANGLRAFLASSAAALNTSEG